MNGVNKVIVIGHLGKDPETRHLPSGGSVTSCTVATTESWKDKQSGERKEATEWHRVTFFNRLAEIAGEFLKKGAKVYIEGSLKTRSYDKDGQKHYVTEIIASEMQMLDSRGEPVSQTRRDTTTRPAAAQPAPAADFIDDDIPF